MTIEERQQEVIEEFEDFDDWMDKYQMLIDLGGEQEPLPEQYKVESNLIDGCQSRVWLQADLTPEGKIHFQAESERHCDASHPCVGQPDSRRHLERRPSLHRGYRPEGAPLPYS